MPNDPWADFEEVKPSGGNADPWAGFEPVQAGVDYRTPVADRPEAAANFGLDRATGISATPWWEQGMFMGHGPSVVDVIDTLPAVGGAVGGALAGAAGLGSGGLGVAAIPGAAALGGEAGEAWRQNLRRAVGAYAPPTSGEAARQIGEQGGVQAAAEVGGQALARVARSAGKAMVEGAVRPPIAMRREFPEVIDTIVAERLPVGARPFGKVTGSERASALLAEESESVRKLLAKATAGGTSFETSKLAEPVLKLIDDIAEQPLAKQDMTRLEKMLDEFTSKKGPLSPLDVQKIKQAAQSIAEPIYAAKAKGEMVTANQALRARFNDAVAKGARQAMETIPGVGEKEARKRALIGAERALSQAEMRRLSLMAESVSGSASVVSALLSKDGGLDDSLRNGAISWALTRGFLSPRTLSRAGLALTSSQAQALIRQFPRLGLYVLSASQAEEEPPDRQAR